MLILGSMPGAASLQATSTTRIRTIASGRSWANWSAPCPPCPMRSDCCVCSNRVLRFGTCSIAASAMAAWIRRSATTRRRPMISSRSSAGHRRAGLRATVLDQSGSSMRRRSAAFALAQLRVCESLTRSGMPLRAGLARRPSPANAAILGTAAGRCETSDAFRQAARCGGRDGSRLRRDDVWQPRARVRKSRSRLSPG